MTRMLILAILMCAPAAPRAADAPKPSKPNIIVFLVDDMGWMDCGVNGSKYYETPNIDRFAKDAMRFTDAYAQPLCSPTRASLLTGKYSARHGITSASGHLPPQPANYKYLPDNAPPSQPMLVPKSKNFMEPSEHTLAEALRNAGYRTAHIGKWHLGLTQPYWPEEQGFDTAFHCHPDPGPPGSYFSPYGVSPEGTPGGKDKVGTITDGPPGEYIVDRLADEAIRFIEANRDRPFFLNLWNYGVHGPWGHKVEYTKAFASKKDPRGVQGNPIMASMLKSVDECFGRVLDTLNRLGIADNTIVVFNSDNGGNTHSNTAEDGRAQRRKADDPFMVDWRKWAGTQPPTINAPLRDGKGSLYEGGTRVPLMWSWPGRIKPGTTSNAVVGHIDLYPTLLDMVGLSRPAQQKIDGVSYANVLKQTGALERKAFFNYFPHGRSAGHAGGVWVRSGDWKLIRWFGVPPADPNLRELYNLRDDIGETKNLAPAEPDRVKEMDALIDGFLADTGATYPRPNSAFKPGTGSPARAARPLGGWVPKGCRAEERDGWLIVTGEGPAPFLGLTALKLMGPVTLRLRAKSEGGPAKVQWRTADQDAFPNEGQVQEFALPTSAEGAETTVQLPVKGSLLHLRLYLPARGKAVALDWVELQPASPDAKPTRWDFDAK